MYMVDEFKSITIHFMIKCILQFQLQILVVRVFIRVIFKRIFFMKWSVHVWTYWLNVTVINKRHIQYKKNINNHNHIQYYLVCSNTTSRMHFVEIIRFCSFFGRRYTYDRHTYTHTRKLKLKWKIFYIELSEIYVSEPIYRFDEKQN